MNFYLVYVVHASTLKCIIRPCVLEQWLVVFTGLRSRGKCHWEVANISSCTPNTAVEHYFWWLILSSTKLIVFILNFKSKSPRFLEFNRQKSYYCSTIDTVEPSRAGTGRCCARQIWNRLIFTTFPSRCASAHFLISLELSEKSSVGAGQVSHFR